MGWDSVDSYLATIKAKCSRQLIQFTLNNVTPVKGSGPGGLPTFLVKNYLARGQIQRADVADPSMGSRSRVSRVRNSKPPLRAGGWPGM